MPKRATGYKHPNDGSVWRAQRVFTLFGGLYALLLVLLTIPFFQSHAVYMHFVKWPLNARFDMPEKHGMAPGKAINMRLNASDGVSLGAWFVFADSQGRSPVHNQSDSHARISAAVKNQPTVLFFHGNAASRAVQYRVHHYQVWTSRLGANCLVIDYRGFGDSSGTPTESGLDVDAVTAWNWLLDGGALPHDVLVVGHSLGTAVASRLVRRLEDEGVKPKGLLLLSPFASLRQLVDTYYVLGLLPLMKPLEMVPGARTAIKYFLAIHYDTEAIIANVSVPLVIAHSEDDWDIPYTHSQALFQAILEPHLPLPPALKPNLQQLSPLEMETSRVAYAARREKRGDLVSRTDIDRFGVVERFRDVLHVQMSWGGHDPFGQQEGLQDLVGQFFGLTRS